MKLMKCLSQNLKMIALLTGLTCFVSIASAQSITGKWQVVRETTCIENEIEASADSTEALLDQMKSLGSATPQVIHFKEKGQGEESTRILTKKKTTNNKNFLYKFSGESILILDKKSQTILESYTVDKLTADSLIISNSARACDTKILAKIKEPRTN
jgi:hypothetical protein